MRMMMTLACATALASLGLACPALADHYDGNEVTAETEAAPTTLKRMYRGTTVCTAPDGSTCGTDYWTTMLHADGTRVTQIASETARAGEVRHVTIVVEADGTMREAFMHNRASEGEIGSAYVVQTAGGFEQAVRNGSGLEVPAEGIATSTVASETPLSARTIGTGPAVSDGLHFLHYDMAAGGDQAHEVFWMGGSFGGTMAGSVRPTTYTFVGEEAIPMPQGYDIVTEHFRMSSGSEIWLTKDSRIVVRADVRFGPTPAMRYELMELNVTPIGPQTAP